MPIHYFESSPSEELVQEDAKAPPSQRIVSQDTDTAVTSPRGLGSSLALLRRARIQLVFSPHGCKYFNN